MAISGILMTIVTIVIVYYLITWFFGDSSRTSLLQLHNATVPQTISETNFPTTASHKYTFSICFFVDDWNHSFGKYKTIIARSDKNDNACPRVQFTPYENNIKVTLATYKKGAAEEASKEEEVTVENVPLQRWTNLIITVNDRMVDLYIDGKLVKTKLLTNIPLSTTSAVLLTPDGGFAGSTANFLYFNRTLNPREAYELYKEGCGGGSWFSDLFNRYRVKLAFLKDNVEVNTFVL